MTGQIKLDGSALPEFTVDLRVPLGLPRKSINHRKSKAGSLADRLGREKRFERARHRVGIHARAAVGDRDADVLSRFHLAGFRGIEAVEMRVASLDSELAAPGLGT